MIRALRNLLCGVIVGACLGAVIGEMAVDAIDKEARQEEAKVRKHLSETDREAYVTGMDESMAQKVEHDWRMRQTPRGVQLDSAVTFSPYSGTR